MGPQCRQDCHDGRAALDIDHAPARRIGNRRLLRADHFGAAYRQLTAPQEPVFPRAASIQRIQSLPRYPHAQALARGNKPPTTVAIERQRSNFARPRSGRPRADDEAVPDRRRHRRRRRCGSCHTRRNASIDALQRLIVKFLFLSLSGNSSLFLSCGDVILPIPKRAGRC